MRGMRVAGALHRGMEGDRVGIALGAAAVEHRREVGAAAEPGFRRHHIACVHVHGRHMRIVQMRDQRNAGGVEARIVGGAGDVLAKFRREFAEHGRDVDADFLEDAAFHYRHHAAAAGGAGVIGAAPRRAHEAAGGTVGERRVRGEGVLDRLEGRQNPVAQALEPGFGTGFALFASVGIHGRIPPVCRSASPAAMAAAIAILSERRPGRSGMTRRASAAA